MPRYFVRCCCQPQKILGVLELRHPVGGRSTVHVRERLRFPTCSLRRFDANEPMPATAIRRYHAIKLRIFDRNEIAVYSEDRPIEFWRTIEGFRENKNAAGEVADGVD